MSRVAKMPVTIPKGVEVHVDGRHVVVTGPKGTLNHDLHALVEMHKG